MTSLIGRFQRDLPYLENNQIPLTSSDYKGEPEEKLRDDDVKVLCLALLKNDKFSGPLDLSNNDLTDLVIFDFNTFQSALYLSDVLNKVGGQNITELNLSKNNLQYKTGIYIGDALVQNNQYPINHIALRDIQLDLEGVTRLMNGVNQNKNIKRLHVGIVDNEGLLKLAQQVGQYSRTQHLVRFEFQEEEKEPWSDKAMQEIVFSVSVSELEYVKFTTSPGKEEDERYRTLKQEIDFHTEKKIATHKKQKRFEDRQEQCNTDKMFENILALIETKEAQKKMPVRKFFNNTFGTILNDAIFALKKKQSKEPQNEQLFTKRGSVKFVAMYILENLPQHEREPDLYDSSDSRDGD
ncbi:UNKNOWN [Stylonychia lemnae]|uniref:Uncharacterized protein n=1 Tax=Stylonychia lemnae TaxID=5949 RepID=A0A077ZW40_STYLE|nr:UNKNOWN [Stylonychia lemnae]|eukprot:CDW74170.1 UNKNOWN [Stylonychia lemnae]